MPPCGQAGFVERSPKVARVLMVFQPPDGGVLRNVSELAGGLTASGHEVFLCGTRRPREFSPDRFVELEVCRGVAPGADGRAMGQVARVVSRCRPDVVHLHSSKAGAVGRLARWAAPFTPVVYSPHGYAFAGHFERGLERRAYRAIEMALAPLASRVLCVCEAERRLAAAIGPASRTRVVHNGVAAAPAGAPPPRGASGEHGHGPVLVLAAPLRPGKGIETAIDAMPRVLMRHPTATLLIAGGGAESGALEHRARSVGLDTAVRFLGEVADTAGVLGGADVVIHPSWAESFPYAVLEAMAAGAPIVATDVGGTDEAIHDGCSGLLVPPHDAKQLAAAIGALLDDAELARRLGAAARERAQSCFTLPRMVTGTLDVYAEVSDGFARGAARDVG